MKPSVFLLVVLAAGAVQPAQAQVMLDVSKVTCDQWSGYKITNPQNIALWLSGYYSGKRNTTTVDVEQLKETARKVRSYCLYNKGTVMEAVESLMATIK